MIAVNSIRKDQFDWWDEYHSYITFSLPLSLVLSALRVLEGTGLPEVYVCDSKQE